MLEHVANLGLRVRYSQQLGNNLAAWPYLLWGSITWARKVQLRWFQWHWKIDIKSFPMMYNSPYWSRRLTLKFWATFSMKVEPRRGKASCWQQLGLATPKSQTSLPGNCDARCQRALRPALLTKTPSQWARSMMNELFLSKSSNTSSNWAKNSTKRSPHC